MRLSLRGFLRSLVLIRVAWLMDVVLRRVTSDLGKDGGLCPTARCLCGDCRPSVLKGIGTTTSLCRNQGYIQRV